MSLGCGLEPLGGNQQDLLYGKCHTSCFSVAVSTWPTGSTVGGGLALAQGLCRDKVHHGWESMAVCPVCEWGSWWHVSTGRRKRGNRKWVQAMNIEVCSQWCPSSSEPPHPGIPQPPEEGLPAEDESSSRGPCRIVWMGQSFDSDKFLKF